MTVCNPCKIHLLFHKSCNGFWGGGIVPEQQEEATEETEIRDTGKKKRKPERKRT